MGTADLGRVPDIHVQQGTRGLPTLRRRQSPPECSSLSFCPLFVIETNVANLWVRPCTSPSSSTTLAGNVWLPLKERMGTSHMYICNGQMCKGHRDSWSRGTPHENTFPHPSCLPLGHFLRGSAYEGRIEITLDRQSITGPLPFNSLERERRIPPKDRHQFHTQS